MDPERLENILDGWWWERKRELLERLMDEIRANVGDGSRQQIESLAEFTDEVYVPYGNNIPPFPIISMFSDTIDPSTNNEELTRMGMNLINFPSDSILNIFPVVPILPKPEMETNNREVMSEPTRQRFFANFTLPGSFEWPVVVNRSLPVNRMEESEQECSI